MLVHTLHRYVPMYLIVSVCYACEVSNIEVLLVVLLCKLKGMYGCTRTNLRG